MDPSEILDKLLRPGGSAAGAADVIGLVGSTLGLGFLSGFRLYATLVALGLAIRFQWFVPNETMATLSVLADWRVLAAASIMGLIEFLADKVPWVDSAWDSIHTFIRPLAAMALAATALGNVDPVGKTVLALLCGGVALTTHSAKAATRFAVNHSPEPFSNWMLSTAEDLAAPLALWFISSHPGVFLGLLALFLTLFAYLAPRVVRQMRLELVALRTLISRWAGTGPTIDASLPSVAAANPKAREMWNLLHGYLDELPADFVNKSGCQAGIQAAATKSLIGMNRSIGYLFFRDHKLTFMTRRWFKTMAHSMPYADVKSATLQNGLFLDQLILEDLHGHRLNFDLFRVAPNGATSGVKMTASAAGPAAPSA